MGPLRVLLVEDVESDAELVVRALRRAGYAVQSLRIETAQGMRAALERADWDIVISDYDLPQFDAPRALAVLQASGRDLPFIVVSGTIGEDIAVSMMRRGAHDYLMKGNLQRLGPAVTREVTEARMRRERRELEADVRSISAAEQQRLGMELHDGLGQELTGIALMLGALASRAQQETLPIAAELDEICRLASRAVATTRSIAHGLLPVGETTGALARALCALVTATGEAHRIGASLRSERLLERPMPADVAQQLYRIAQEAITNSLRHARATRVEVELEFDAAAETLHLAITDDGCGFDAEGHSDASRGRGLEIMPTRARMIGGQLRIEPHPDGGTRVVCSCPLPPPD